MTFHMFQDRITLPSFDKTEGREDHIILSSVLVLFSIALNNAAGSRGTSPFFSVPELLLFDVLIDFVAMLMFLFIILEFDLSVELSCRDWTGETCQYPKKRKGKASFLKSCKF